MRFKPINLDKLDEYLVVCGDFETTGLNWRKDKPFGIALAALGTEPGVGYSGYFDLRDQPRVLEVLRAKLPRVRKFVNHHAKFDAHVARTAGIVLPFNRIECTMVRAALINEHEQAYNLDFIAKKYIKRGKDETIYQKLAELFGGKPTRDAQIKNLHRTPANVASTYAIPDAEIALELWAWQETEIEAQGLGKIWTLEKELTSVLVDVERGGVPIDEERTRRELARVLPERERVVAALMKKYGGNGIDEKVFNSPKQKRQLFGVEERGGRHYIGPVLLETTGGGAPSIDADVLRLLAETHGDERAQLIQKAQKLDKAKQFLENHILGHLEGDRVYPHFNQTKSEFGSGTTTGRFSIEDPALQQIPARDKVMAEIVRSCFVADKGDEWLSLDYKQFEFRIFAHYVDDPRLIKAYQDNPDTDFHQITADLTGLPRNPRYAGDVNSKQVNLALVFGQGKGRLAQQLGLPYTIEMATFGGEVREVMKAGPEVEAVFNKYHEAVPGVQRILKQASSIAKSRGYVRTAGGRHIRFPGGKFTHKAAGLVFQGSAADSMKSKMIEMYHNGHKQGDFRILLSVHDELNFSVRDPSGELTSRIVRCYNDYSGPDCLTPYRVPITSDAGKGENWYAASK